MPRKARGSVSSPEKQTTTTRRNTRRGQKVSEPAESEVADEIPAHLLRGSDESSEQSDNDSDYGSPKKGRGRAAATRGRGKKTKEPTPKPRRGTRRARGESPAAIEEQNSQEESINSQATIEENETSTMESTSEQRANSDEKQEEQIEENIIIPSSQKSASIEPEEKETSPKNEEPQELEVKQQITAEKVSEVTIEQDQSNNDRATVNEEVVADDECKHNEENQSDDNNKQQITETEKEKSSSPEVITEDDVSKDAPEISMEVDQSDSRSNSPQNTKIQLQRSRSSSGEIHEDSRDESIKENSPKKPQESSPVKKPSSLPKEVEQKPATTTTQRKRKWGARKDDEKVIAITTDSLANVIAEEVKPVPLSDVKLAMSPSPEPEEKRPRVRLTSEDRDAKKKLLKERLRKQEEEEERRNEQIAKATERSQVSPTIVVTNGAAGKDRKVSLVTNEEVAKISSPISKNQCSKVLCITNLVRPLTFLAVKSLVSRTGELDDFWIDSIKSKCFVKYKTEDEAIETRHALHGVKWPEHNLKTLNVEFSTDEEMNRVIENNIGERIRSALAENQEEDSKLQEKSFGWSKSDVSVDERSRVSKRVREWDVGKKEELEHEENSRDRERRRRRSSERENRREKDRKQMEESTAERRQSGSPGREEKDAIPSQPGRLLDDLFRKSKAVPCIYWLPLSEEQIKEKEEQRQKNIAEHNRRMEEIIKNRELQREKMIEERREREAKRREERKDRERKRSRSRSRSTRRYSRERHRDRRYDRR